MKSKPYQTEMVSGRDFLHFAAGEGLPAGLVLASLGIKVAIVSIVIIVILLRTVK